MDAFLQSLTDAFQGIIDFILGIIAQIQNAIDPSKAPETEETAASSAE